MKQPRRLPASPSSDPEGFSRDELRRLGKAEKKLASPDRTQAAAGTREIQDLERRHARRIDDLSLGARLAETSSLALARGEDVRAETVRLAAPQFDERGARIVRDGLPVYRQETHTRVRIASRGGLQLAFERGDLDSGKIRAEQLYETAKAYRWAFETASALTTPARNLAPISGRSPMRASAGPQDAVFAAGEILRVYRAGLGARDVEVLDRVCGHDDTVRATSIALKGDVRTIRRLLVGALTVATETRKASASVPTRPTRLV